ncbi:MAG: LPS-assembly protein LptD [Epsilonproteobacteria bacterium]|nr:LPS-assembly protein LptD [Campylobacterota bacterium]
MTYFKFITRLGLCLLSFALLGNVHAALPKVSTAIDRIKIESKRQVVHALETFTFYDQVDVLIDEKIHLCADVVTFDKKKNIIVAEKKTEGHVKVEGQDFLILTDRFVFDLNDQTGHADSIVLHVDEGYVYAQQAEKINRRDWHIKSLQFTPCDGRRPHWQMKAKRAMLRGGYFIKMHDALFKAGPLPIFSLPRFMLPIGLLSPHTSSSGFLFPRFVLDSDYGIGFKQEYYYRIHEHADTTLGLDWRDRRGIVFFDELRWARSPQDFTLFNAHYAVVNDNLVRRNKRVVSKKQHRYWVVGKDFRTFDLFSGKDIDLNSLVRLDFGTDKRIGYHFFNTIEDVEDSFCNSVIARLASPKNLLELSLDSIKTNRRQFIDFSLTQDAHLHELSQKLACKREQEGTAICKRKELEDRVSVVKVPHFEVNQAWQRIGDFLSYRHDFFIDHIYYRQKEAERTYSNSLLVDTRLLKPLDETSLIRFNYHGNVSAHAQFYSNALTAYFKPVVQVRSDKQQDAVFSKNVWEERVLGRGGYRAFLAAGATWAFPEWSLLSHNGSWGNYFQPCLTWDFVPRFFQDHWYYMDKWDRFFAKNQLGLTLHNAWHKDPWHAEICLSQGYDFFPSKDRFFLDRSVTHEHLLPFRLNAEGGFRYVNFVCDQEYDWKRFNLLQSYCGVGINTDRFNISLGYLYQDRKAQEVRDILTNVSHFLLLNCQIPLGKCATLFYDAQLYAQGKSSFLKLGTVRPLLHRIRFDYAGHCWGFYLGYEQKRYREFGNNRSEHAVVFSLRLDSLGSFAKKFKRPQFIKR